ncbi:MAG: hypothetical protein FWE04_06870 [Oscillospiraceae bacterium]|nr:hypothetical protein [Oscillospiraceae bacterium]
MYYPIQIPFILNKSFARSVKYSEEVVPEFQDFIICLWEMCSLPEQSETVEHIIVTDGCIDIVVNLI